MAVVGKLRRVVLSFDYLPKLWASLAAGDAVKMGVAGTALPADAEVVAIEVDSFWRKFTLTIYSDTFEDRPGECVMTCSRGGPLLAVRFLSPEMRSLLWEPHEGESHDQEGKGGLQGGQREREAAVEEAEDEGRGAGSTPSR